MATTCLSSRTIICSNAKTISVRILASLTIISTRPGQLKARGANPHRDPQAVPGQTFRVQGTPLELRPWMMMDKGGRLNPVHPLAKAPIVKGLLIRQQFSRSIALKTLAQLFKQSLTAVEWFRFKRWTSITGATDKSFWRGNVSVYYSLTETKSH